MLQTPRPSKKLHTGNIRVNLLKNRACSLHEVVHQSVGKDAAEKHDVSTRTPTIQQCHSPRLTKTLLFQERREEYQRHLTKLINGLYKWTCHRTPETIIELSLHLREMFSNLGVEMSTSDLIRKVENLAYEHKEQFFAINDFSEECQEEDLPIDVSHAIYPGDIEYDPTAVYYLPLTATPTSEPRMKFPKCSINPEFVPVIPLNTEDLHSPIWVPNHQIDEDRFPASWGPLILCERYRQPCVWKEVTRWLDYEVVTLRMPGLPRMHCGINNVKIHNEHPGICSKYRRQLRTSVNNVYEFYIDLIRKFHSTTPGTASSLKGV